MGSQTGSADALRAFLTEEAGVRTEAPEEATGPDRSGRREYERPNGQVYLGRAIPPNELGASDDVELLRRCREHGLFARMFSAPGTGKTAALEAAFGEELVTVVISEGTDEDKLFGGYRPDPGDAGTFAWVDGPVKRALEEGRPLCLDEVSAGHPRVLSRLNSLFDGRLRVTLEEHEGEEILAEDGFWAAITYNPGIVGFELSAALESRFSFAIEYTTDAATARAAGVPAKALKLAKRLWQLREKAECQWAPEMRELITFKRVAEALGETWAARNLVGQAPEEERDLVAAEAEAVFGTEGARGLRI